MGKTRKAKPARISNREKAVQTMPRGMYLEVVLKDNKGDGAVLCSVQSPTDTARVEAAIRRMVRHYLRNFPLVPPKGFYSLLVMPRWVALEDQQPGGVVPSSGRSKDGRE